MGTCESRPHEGNDIQITTDPRFMKGKEPTEPGSPSFPTSVSITFILNFEND